MKASLIDGRKISAEKKAEIKLNADKFEELYGRKVGLAVIIVGNDPASTIYVRNKIKACEECNIKSFSYELDENSTQKHVEDLIDVLNEQSDIDGILVQVPLPKHLDEKALLKRIKVEKDVDGFSAYNVGNLVLGNSCLRACTPAGIIELIKSTGVEIASKHAVVIGRSNTVGKPIAIMLLENNATVTICHSKTENLQSYTKQADIVVCSVGKKDVLTADMVKDGAIVIDVGMNRVDGKLYGDVNFENVAEVAGYITPVPGGVGPMTVTMLLDNTVKAAYRGK